MRPNPRKATGVEVAMAACSSPGCSSRHGLLEVPPRLCSVQAWAVEEAQLMQMEQNLEGGKELCELLVPFPRCGETQLKVSVLRAIALIW